MRFGSYYDVIRRFPGTYVQGVWQPYVEPFSVKIRLDIQPATVRQFQMVEALPEGRRNSQILCAFAAVGTNLKVPDAKTRHPGDLVVINGNRWLVIGRADFTSLGTQRATSHEVYIIQSEIEKATGEAPV